MFDVEKGNKVLMRFGERGVRKLFIKIIDYNISNPDYALY